MLRNDHQLTPGEKKVIDHLNLARIAFGSLTGQHPSDQHEFDGAMHLIQGLIACRVAGRVDPDQWWTPEREH